MATRAPAPAALPSAPAALLDTHLVLWAALQPTRLPRAARLLLKQRSNPVVYSVASLWEVAIKSSLARPDFQVDADELRQWLLSQGISELPIQASHVLKVAQLPWHHRDPFDRLLVAQAVCERLTLWTADAAMAPYGPMVKRLLA